jgi:hypothetical protein
MGLTVKWERMVEDWRVRENVEASHFSSSLCSLGMFCHGLHFIYLQPFCSLR